MPNHNILFSMGVALRQLDLLEDKALVESTTDTVWEYSAEQTGWINPRTGKVNREARGRLFSLRTPVEGFRRGAPRYSSLRYDSYGGCCGLRWTQESNYFHTREPRLVLKAGGPVAGMTTIMEGLQGHLSQFNDRRQLELPAPGSIRTYPVYTTPIVAGSGICYLRGYSTKVEHRVAAPSSLAFSILTMHQIQYGAGYVARDSYGLEPVFSWYNPGSRNILVFFATKDAQRVFAD